MLNIFEQPWTLLIAAVATLPVLLMVRSIFPEKRHWWQLALPPLLAVAAFGLDLFVQTDLEKINVLIDTGIKAAKEENPNAIDAVISANYHDSYHNTKKDLMDYCRALFSQPLIEKNKKLALAIEISPPTATATFTVLTRFDKQSYVYQSFKSQMLVKVQINLQKQPDKSWLINRAEILELDRQPVNWKNIEQLSR